MRKSSSILAVVVCSWLGSTLGGCSGAAGPEAVQAGVDVRTVPWPSDALLDGTLHVSTPLPFDAGNEDNLTRLAAALSELDGFGTVDSVFFPINGPINASMNGPAADVIVDAGATATVIDLDGNEPPRAFPLLYRRETKQLVAISPTGTVLSEHHRYGCFVARGVHDQAGHALRPSGGMAEAIAGHGAVGAKPAYQALARALSAMKVHPLAATAFTTRTLTAWVPKVLGDLGPSPRAQPTRLFHAGAELDALFGGAVTTTRPGLPPSGGVLHDHVAFAVEGTYASPHYLSATPGQLGLFDDVPTVRATDTIPFLLVLPKAPSLASVPVVIFQHGIDSDRSAVLTVADDYAARGYATLGIDELWHGSRQPGAVDLVNNLTGSGAPDGIGDPGSGAVANFFDFAGDSAHGVAALDPRIMRDNFRQATIDLMEEVRLAKSGDWTLVAAADPALAGLSLDGRKLVYTGESFGSILGAQVLALDPQLDAAVLDVGGGGLFLDLIGNSASFAQLLQPFVAGGYDQLVDVNDPVNTPIRAQMSLNLIQTVMEPGDGLALAGGADAAKSVVFLEAFNDEVVSNQSTEALATAWRATQVTLKAHSQPTRVVTMPAVPAPLAATPLHALVQLDPATHGMFTSQSGERKYADGFPPFMQLAQPTPVDNPIELAHAIALDFIDGVRAGAPRVDDPQ